MPIYWSWVLIESAALGPQNILGYELAGGVDSRYLVLRSLVRAVHVSNLWLIVTSVVRPVRFDISEGRVRLPYWSRPGSDWSIGWWRNSVVVIITVGIERIHFRI